MFQTDSLALPRVPWYSIISRAFRNNRALTVYVNTTRGSVILTDEPKRVQARHIVMNVGKSKGGCEHWSFDGQNCFAPSYEDVVMRTIDSAVLAYVVHSSEM